MSRQRLQFVASLFTLILSTKAQLLGCDSIGCPKDASNEYSCPVGNITANAVGITNLSSTISSDPLTWTTTFSSEASPSNSSLDILQRSYLLGTPPSLNLGALDGIKGCALFFEDVVQRQDFGGNAAGSCQDFLGQSCVADLVSQTNKTFSDILTADDNPTFICSNLAVELRSNAPSSCKLAYDGLWGAIVVRDLTDNSPPSPITVDPSCSKISGDAYTVDLIESQQIETVPDADTVNSFARGVTPIITIFYPSDASGRDKRRDTVSILEPEFHLTCLKPVAESIAVVEQQNAGAIFLPRWTALAGLLVSILCTSFAL